MYWGTRDFSSPLFFGVSSDFVPERPLDWSWRLDDFVQSVSWAPDGSSLIAAVSGGSITLFEAQAPKPRRVWPGHEGGTFAASFSPTESRIASVGQDGTARLWTPDFAEALAVWEAGENWVEQLAWAPDGSQFAVGAGRKVALIRPDGVVAHQLSPRRSTVTALTWRADSHVLAAASYGEVQGWQATSGEPEEPMPWKTSLISLSWSPDQRWIVAGTQEQSVQIWELPYRPGEELAMSGYPGKVRELAWHHNGRFLATGGGPEIMVWDCQGSGPAGTTPRILMGHGKRVTSLAYQRSGHLLASGSEDGQVRLWNAGKSTSALRLFRLPAPVSAVAWSRDDRRLGMGCQDGTLAVVTVDR